MSIVIGILTAIHVLVALFIIVLVLMQKSSEQGVGAAFGGGMTETVFGAGTTTALVRMTIWCACLLLLTTLVLAVLQSHRGKGPRSLMQRNLATQPAAPGSPSESPFSAQPSPLPAPMTPGAKPAAAPTAPAQSSPAPSTPASQPQKTP
ncbi:MAG TPA: preprotein translocase subunit SecG [Verrucomicrobiae bacterium]|nr:preprotein translocase subunit SecG [Verrucomicrobiae bacterium]